MANAWHGKGATAESMVLWLVRESGVCVYALCMFAKGCQSAYVGLLLGMAAAQATYACLCTGASMSELSAGGSLREDCNALAEQCHLAVKSGWQLGLIGIAILSVLSCHQLIPPSQPRAAGERVSTAVFITLGT